MVMTLRNSFAEVKKQKDTPFQNEAFSNAL